MANYKLTLSNIQKDILKEALGFLAAMYRWDKEKLINYSKDWIEWSWKLVGPYTFDEAIKEFLDVFNLTPLPTQADMVDKLANRIEGILSDDDIILIVNALDSMTRIGIGQFEYFFDRRWEVGWNEKDWPVSKIKMGLGLSINSSWGITNPIIPDRTIAAYDMMCVIRKKWAAENETNQWSVWHNDPLHLSKQPLPKIEIV